MEKEDLALRLIRGKPIEVQPFGEVIPLTIGEVEAFGYTRYIQLVNLLCTPPNEQPFFEELKQYIYDISNDIDILQLAVIAGGQIKAMFLQAIMLFTRQPASIDSFGLLLIGDFTNDKPKPINSEALKEFIRVVKLQNGMMKLEQAMEHEEIKQLDERARRIKEKMMRNREEVRKAKMRQGENVDGEKISFSDIVSSVAAKSNTYNLQTIWDCTLFQLYDQYNRLRMIDNFEISVQAMMAGASDVKLEHWSTKIS